MRLTGWSDLLNDDSWDQSEGRVCVLGGNKLCDMVCELDAGGLYADLYSAMKTNGSSEIWGVFFLRWILLWISKTENLRVEADRSRTSPYIFTPLEVLSNDCPLRFFFFLPPWHLFWLFPLSLNPHISPQSFPAVEHNIDPVIKALLTVALVAFLRGSIAS